jgi:hypothetical protein
LKMTNPKMTIIPLLVLMLLSALAAGVCDAGVTKEIRFPPSSNSTVIEQSVIRGERDLYYLTAKAGQTLAVSLAALENNAVFAIYQPGYEVTPGEDGLTAIKGAALAGAGESDDAMVWEGTLPVSGKYLIVVGGTRGNATYGFKITIR